MKIIHFSLIALFLFSSIFAFIQEEKNLDILGKNTSTFESDHWDVPINGTFTIQLMNLPLNNSGEWYDLPTSTPSNTNLSIQVEFNATNLELGRDYTVHFQLWSVHQNYSLIKHSDVQFQLFNTSVVYGNDQNHTFNQSIQMIDHVTNLDQANSRMYGCYWVEYKVTKLKISGTSLPSGISERVSFGEACPTDDSDFDGWSDTQERIFGSNLTDSNSTPATAFSNLYILYSELLEQYNQSQITDTDGDSWSDEHEEIFGSDANNFDSTPLTILAELNSLLAATNLSLSLCENGWSNANSSLQSCHESLNNSLGCLDCDCVTCPDFDYDDDGWSDSVEFLCGTNSSDNGSMPTELTGAICWELADDDLDGVRNMDDLCPSSLNGTVTINTTGCAVVCQTCNQSEDPISVKTDDDDDIEITGGGDVVDLIVIGGGALLTGIGLSSLLNQIGTGEFNKFEPDSPKKEKIKDIIDEIDLDLDLDLDSDEKTRVAAVDNESTNQSASDQYFKSGVERQKAMTSAADPLLDDYVEHDED